MSEYKIPKRYIKLLDKRLLKIEAGEEKFYTWEEVKSKIKKLRT
jgi:Putative addiction module component